ncbi:surface-adhesin E family protein [Noviherbaspirillum humi]|nr:surface-adhesin E family protein [Noviherbaspirillum humi]
MKRQGNPPRFKTFSLLLLAAAPALAASGEWTRIGLEAQGVTYADRGSLRRNGDLVSIWTLFDADVPQLQRENEYAHSSRVQIEFNCAEHLARTVNVVNYAERMAAGKVVGVRSVPQNWEVLAPNTPQAAIFKLACPKS